MSSSDGHRVAGFFQCCSWTCYNGQQLSSYGQADEGTGPLRRTACDGWVPTGLLLWGLGMCDSTPSPPLKPLVQLAQRSQQSLATGCDAGGAQETRLLGCKEGTQGRGRAGPQTGRACLTSSQREAGGGAGRPWGLGREAQRGLGLGLGVEPKPPKSRV